MEGGGALKGFAEAGYRSHFFPQCDPTAQPAGFLAPHFKAKESLWKVVFGQRQMARK